MLNHWARKMNVEIRAFSAGSAPSGRVNSLALAALAQAGIDASGYRSKSWDEFLGDSAPKMRVVITVCDSAAAEPCPYWPGSPVKVHWSYPDPSDVPEQGKKVAFELTREAIGYRLLQLIGLPFKTMDDFQLQQALNNISKT